jgi:uncharacterized protein (DUF2235 family)
MKRLVLLFDGTWNDKRYPDAATNIVRLWQLIAKGTRDAAIGVEQRIFYDAGVGTGLLDRLPGGIFGSGLSEKVREGYRFLSQFYETGDEIYIFGFSRGAFTARSLAGFVAASGLLRQNECSKQNSAFAWGYYRTPPKKRWPADKASLQKLCTPDVTIKFLGVFDTVGALGVPVGWAGNWGGDHFHDTKLGSAIEFAFHAVAIDEHRGPFVPTLWAEPEHHHKNHCVEQVWFPGVHSDIGGGFKIDPEVDREAISEISLHWMISRLQTHTKIEIAKPERPLAGKPAKPHDYLGWFLLSQLAPTYRLIREAPLTHRLKRPHYCYTLPPPDHPYKECLHVSALDLLATTRRYRPPNLLSALKRQPGKEPLLVVDYAGKELTGSEVDSRLKRIHHL